MKHFLDFQEVNIYLRGLIPLVGFKSSCVLYKRNARLAGIIWAVVAFFFGYNVTGWASTMCAICFLGGVQLLSIGIIGEYVGKTYMESKHRPRYIISDKTD